MYIFLGLIITGFAQPQIHSAYSQNQSSEKPNIIVILADDLGYGDTSVYGGNTPTPNIDKLASEGLRFTDFHSNGANCSPTRAALLTGRYQQRMGIEGALGEHAKGLGSVEATNERTIADYLRKAGYQTALVGKWHLGYNQEQNPIHFGFDQFVGMLHGATDYHSHVNTFGRFDWWHNEKLVKEEGYVTDLITSHSVDFIQEWKEEPFFLMVSHLAIHFPWQTPDDEPHRVEGSRYRANGDEPLSRHGQHSPEDYHEVVGIMIRELDKSVGQIVDKIYDTQLENQTMIFFLSDNGGILEQSGYPVSSNGILRGAKHSLYEGGHRIPAIVWWPGKIEADRVSHETAITMDILPTFMDILKIPVPDEESTNRLDGISIASLIFDKKTLPARTLFWKKGDEIAVRSGTWKFYQPSDQSQVELYNLDNSMREDQNLSQRYPHLVKDLKYRAELWINNVTQ
jgi:arylsulfatase A-like enzyme